MKWLRIPLFYIGVARFGRRKPELRAPALKIGSHGCAHAPLAGEVMAMAKPTTERGKLYPPPPYTRWDQRGRPVLQATLKLPDGTTVRAMLNTDDRKIALQRMQLIVVSLLREWAPSRK